MALLTKYSITVLADGFPDTPDFFVLGITVATADEPNMQVFLNGLLLNYGSDYTISVAGTELQYYNNASGHILKAGDIFIFYY